MERIQHMDASAYLAALQKVGAILEDKGSINLAAFREVLEDTCGPAGIIEPLPDEDEDEGSAGSSVNDAEDDPYGKRET